MESSLARAITSWAEFYTFLGTVAATFLGLLFVAISLRLSIFHEKRVRDARDLAALTFGNFLCLVLIAGLFLIPDESRLEFGLPLIAFGVLGLAGDSYVLREAGRSDTENFSMWALGVILFLLATYLSLAVMGIAILAGHAGALPWLVAVDAALLTTAVFTAWLLLAHAQPG